MSERTRRKAASRDPRDKFAALREAKEKGARGRLQSYKVEQDDDVYDEVDEQEYKTILRNRLETDDFVDDDDGSGYVDNGVDDWDNQDDYESLSDEDAPRQRKDKKNSKSKKDDSKINKFFGRKPAVMPVKPVITSEKENDFMSDLLGTLETTLPTVADKVRKRKVETLPYSHVSAKYSSDLSSFDDPIEPSSDSVDLDPPFRDALISTPSKKPRINNAVKVQPNSSFENENMSMDIDTDEPVIKMEDLEETSDITVKPLQARDVNASRRYINMAGSKPAAPKPVKIESTNSNWDSVSNQMNLLNQSMDQAVGTNISVLEDDGSMQFFWLEYSEINGHLYLFGKALDKQSQSYVSCCVSVSNIERNVFVLPRTRRVVNGHETDRSVTMEDVYQEVDAIRSKHKVTTWAAKPVSRKYAFELEDVPAESDYLKVVYSFQQPALPTNLQGETFGRIFGANTSAFELFVLKRKIMGPCWLEIKNASMSNRKLSWCKAEVEVTDPKKVRAYQDSEADAPKDTPPLCIVNLTFRTVMNHKDNRKEIVVASCLTYPKVLLEDTTPVAKLPATMVTAIRPLEHNFPSGFETLASRQSSKIECSRNERQLLSFLTTNIARADPDIIVGHAIDGADLDVLLHRLRELKIPTWNRLGRLRKAQWPKMAGGFRKSSYYTKEVLSGRMLCDLLNFKDMISSTTWSLCEIVGTHLKQHREDIDPDKNPGYFDPLRKDGAAYLMHFLQHCQTDAAYIMQIMINHQILQLTKQLTNLAGNSWARTMLGARSERNAFLLLHEFHRSKYICPDQPSYAGKKAQQDLLGDEDAAPSAKKKDKYKGGLVFEPRRGLYDRYILVMDFNSLYPSIIQEFNICFTTVDRSGAAELDEAGEEKVPNLPEPDTPQGFLPRMLATLVNRRKAVKNLMKDKSTSPAKMIQYNIKQQALKLTANSMYGCLGLPGSRFYAKELAMLVTFKGREILTNTKELAESLQLDVIYGDTDSVMINSKVMEMGPALQIGNEFKKKVNERYKLLEIDIDHVFTRMLLHKKKKYAALKAEEKNGKIVTELEIKGLDLKRREYCALSKDVQEYVLQQILSGEESEIVVEKIHEYLTKVGNDMREGKYPLEKYTIFKSLGKDPEEYGTAKGQPHVQVALRMRAKGQNVRQGNVVPHIFCLEQATDEGKTDGHGVGDRAFHPDEVRRDESNLKVDQEYYILHQILSSVERLCEPIDGTDRARLAECLGLDPQRFRSHYGGSQEEPQMRMLASAISDEERYRDADKLKLICRHCHAEMAFNGLLVDKDRIVSSKGIICPNSSCGQAIGAGSLSMQLNVQIRQHVERYYEGWLVCEELACRHRTKAMSVYGRRCPVTGCRGSMRYEYTDEQLYNQLMYFDYLFDADKAKKNSKKEDAEIVNALVEMNRPALADLRRVVNRYIDRCGRRYIEMEAMFRFTKELKL